MVSYVNDCVNCDLNECHTCGRQRKPIRVCDRCGQSAIAALDGEDLCDECLDKALEEVIREDCNWLEIYRALYPSNDLNLLYL